MAILLGINVVLGLLVVGALVLAILRREVATRAFKVSTLSVAILMALNALWSILEMRASSGPGIWLQVILFATAVICALLITRLKTPDPS